MNWEAAGSAVGIGMAVLGYLGVLVSAVAMGLSIDRQGLRWLIVPIFAFVGVLGTGMAVGFA